MQSEATAILQEIRAIEADIAQSNDSDERYYQLGNLYRRQSDWQRALECYAEAVERNPESPARRAAEMLDNILAYRCKEMFNP